MAPKRSSGKPRMIWLTQLDTPPATKGKVPSSKSRTSTLSARGNFGLDVGEVSAVTEMGHVIASGPEVCNGTGPGCHIEFSELLHELFHQPELAPLEGYFGQIGQGRDFG